MLKEQAPPFPYLAKQARKQTPQKSRGQYNPLLLAAVSWLTASFRVLYEINSPVSQKIVCQKLFSFVEYFIPRKKRREPLLINKDSWR